MSAASPFRSRSGFALALLSAICFGALPIMGKFAYAEGLAVAPLLAWRFSIGCLALWALVLLRPGRGGIPAPRRAALVALGALYSVNSGLYFLALERIPATMTSLVFYIYPAIVALLGVAVFRRRMRRLNVLALALALLGVALTVGFAPGPLDPGGVALAFGAAAVVAIYLILGEVVLVDLPTIPATAFVLTGTAVACWVWQAFGGGIGTPPSTRAWGIVMTMALPSTAVAIVAMLGAISRIGAAATAIVNTIEPAVTAGLATLLLGERLTPRQLLGGAAILAGVILLRLASREPFRLAAPSRGSTGTAKLFPTGGHSGDRNG